MPKLLSRSKHKEFEPNSTLQIRNQKERRAENARKLGHYKRFAWLRKFAVLRNYLPCLLFTFQPCDTVPAARLNFCLFVPLLISSHFVLEQLTTFVDFSNLYCFGAVYKPKQTCNRIPFCSLINFLGGKLSALPTLSPVSLIFSHFLGSQTPSKEDNSEDEWLEPPPP